MNRADMARAALNQMRTYGAALLHLRNLLAITDTMIAAGTKFCEDGKHETLFTSVKNAFLLSTDKTKLDPTLREGLKTMLENVQKLFHKGIGFDELQLLITQKKRLLECQELLLECLYEELQTPAKTGGPSFVSSPAVPCVG